jgi:hypothetical protein
MSGATAARERHAARARSRTAPAPRLPRRVSGPAPRPRVAPAPKPVTSVFERIRALPDHRVIDRLLRGRVWICFVGVALMGIVAMQVSLLKLNSGISRAVETAATLERQNSGMEASIARLASGERIRVAADRRGMVTPQAGAVKYVRVRGAADDGRALRRMRPPSEAARELMANNGVAPGSLMAPVVPVTGTAPAGTTTTATTQTTPATGTTPTAGTTPDPGTTGTTPGTTTAAPQGTASPTTTENPTATPAPTTGGTTTATAPVG